MVNYTILGVTASNFILKYNAKGDYDADTVNDGIWPNDGTMQNVPNHWPGTGILLSFAPGRSWYKIQMYIKSDPVIYLRTNANGVWTSWVQV